jgi:excisionase family DNA binding protein
MHEDLLVVLREIFRRNAYIGRLAYSPDEAAELLGISRELCMTCCAPANSGSVKAGRRRLIGKHHLEEFLAGEQ